MGFLPRAGGGARGRVCPRAGAAALCRAGAELALRPPDGRRAARGGGGGRRHGRQDRVSRSARCPTRRPRSSVLPALGGGELAPAAAPFDALLLPEGGDAAEAARAAAQGGRDRHRAGAAARQRAVGRPVDRRRAGARTAAGSPPRRPSRGAISRAAIQATYGHPPPRLASLAFDAAALAAVLAKSRRRPTRSRSEAILNPSGFTGVDGLFRFTQRRAGAARSRGARGRAAAATASSARRRTASSRSSGQCTRLAPLVGQQRAEHRVEPLPPGGGGGEAIGVEREEAAVDQPRQARGRTGLRRRTRPALRAAAATRLRRGAAPSSPSPRPRCRGRSAAVSSAPSPAALDRGEPGFGQRGAAGSRSCRRRGVTRPCAPGPMPR